MTWRWCTRRRARPPVPDDTARIAAAESAQRLEQARSLTGEVQRVSRELRQIRQRNNFAALVRSAFGEHR